MYDFNDRRIEMMVSRDHNPQEDFSTNVAGFSESLGIICNHCYQKWPCPPIAQLSEFEAKREEEAAKERGRQAMARRNPPQPRVIKLPHE